MQFEPLQAQAGGERQEVEITPRKTQFAGYLTAVLERGDALANEGGGGQVFTHEYIISESIT